MSDNRNEVERQIDAESERDALLEADEAARLRAENADIRAEYAGFTEAAMKDSNRLEAENEALKTECSRLAARLGDLLCVRDALRGQVAALRGLLTVFLAEWEDENEAGLARSVVAFRQVLADTASAAREHDEAVL